MSLTGLIPAELSTFAAIAICAIAFVSGTARGFSGFGSALIFVPVVNILWFLALNGYLMGREYFSLAAVRRMSWKEARRLRARYAAPVFFVGVVAAIVPFFAPLFGASAMTRLISSLSARSDRS